MHLIGFSESQQLMMFRILASILHLGNLTIVKGGKNQDDAESSLIPVRFILFLFYYILIYFSYIDTLKSEFKLIFCYMYVCNDPFIQRLFSFDDILET